MDILTVLPFFFTKYCFSLAFSLLFLLGMSLPNLISCNFFVATSFNVSLVLVN